MPFFSQWKLRFLLALQGKRCGVQVLSSVDSTNLLMKTLARENKISAPYLITAHTQTAGRGRLGRTFVSPKGTGLYMSLLVSPPPGTDPGKLTILAAVSVCKAIEEMTSLRPKIKWVNDLFVKGRKVCGILAEGAGNRAVIGIGVNLKTPPGGFPPEAGIAGALDTPIDREKLCARIAAHFLAGMENLQSPAILDFYRSRMPLMGRDISYTENGQQKNARVTGVSEDGGLMIEKDGKESVLRTGEVTLGSQAFSFLE